MCYLFKLLPIRLLTYNTFTLHTYLCTCVCIHTSGSNNCNGANFVKRYQVLDDGFKTGSAHVRYVCASQYNIQ